MNTVCVHMPSIANIILEMRLWSRTRIYGSFTLIYSFAVLVIPIYFDLAAVVMAVVKTQPSAAQVQIHTLEIQ